MVRTDSTKAAKDISVRYYFDSSEISNVNSVKPSELYDQAAVEAAPADGVISGPYKYDKKDNTYYIEVKWDGYTIANSGKSISSQLVCTTATNGIPQTTRIQGPQDL